MEQKKRHLTCTPDFYMGARCVHMRACEHMESHLHKHVHIYVCASATYMKVFFILLFNCPSKFTPFSSPPQDKVRTHKASQRPCLRRPGGKVTLAMSVSVVLAVHMIKQLVQWEKAG